MHSTGSCSRQSSVPAVSLANVTYRAQQMAPWSAVSAKGTYCCPLVLASVRLADMRPIVPVLTAAKAATALEEHMEGPEPPPAYRVGRA